ncbi:hypothetical protein vBVpaS1601_90 [Vibrio phage vB_VpaS_1601]|nr:hypothetical protein vBVpaP1601_2 [Vibrio phage vB_VpaP_1601]WHM52783.1 hypothetical protein vBVpaP1601_90 [Vibrio phage vB_VpaP_1601]
MTNKYLSIFAEQTKAIEAEQTASLSSTINQSITNYTQLAEAASQALSLDITPEAHRLYGLLTSTAATDSVSSLSGAELASTVISLITAYFNGNKEALQPVVDATCMWIASKHNNEVKTANIPNNLRLLVSRKSSAYAQENDIDTKLILSVEDKNIIIKEAPLKPKKLTSKAQKVFTAITGLDHSSRDELVQLISTDAQLMSMFATAIVPISSTTATKQSPNQEAKQQLKARLEAAVNKEDKLMDEYDFAKEEEEALLEKLIVAKEALEENEKLLTNQRKLTEGAAIKAKRARKPESVEAANDELEVAQNRMEELLTANTELTSEVNALAKKVEKAMKSVASADEAYNAQANYVAQLSKQVNSVAVH